VVDDTVHFLTKYLHARRTHQMTPDNAVRYAFHKGGVALITTSLALATGFGILGFSSFEINSSMGILTAIAIGLALILDMFMLPALLLLIDNPKRAASTTKANKSELPLNATSTADAATH